MKNILPVLLIPLLISCNNGKEQAEKLQHQNDSLKTAMQLQVQKRQLDSLTAIQNNINAKNKIAKDSIRQQNLNMWQVQLQQMKANVDADKATLDNVSQYHFGRFASTRESEITDASNKLEQDKVLVQQYSDSVRKYQ